ncbi:SusC/RagA family TonB-linked outer membrane protein [Pedobacter psychroterrae]|nr:SusC/RagA family TonB-linked outer membrane protein [Pedobacter psychroterrae]
MRLTTVILIASLVQVSASTFAQRITMDRRNVSLETILKDIRTQTGYSFVYDVMAVNNAKNVSVSVTEAEINDVLNKALNGLGLDYKIDGKIISIRQQINEVKSGQTSIEIRGRVVDNQGYPLSDVSVILKGTKVGTATDIDGNYIIKVPDPNSVLIFSYVGFKTQEMPVKEQNRINVVMEMGISNLDEVVLITTGYQRIKPEQSTGSISTLQEKQFNSRINTTDFIIGLQNKLPGLLVNNDIKYKEEPLFQIRGISTFNGIRKPLIVVDGYPTELELASINPNEIESITILKDAAAATIYGARSSNGVIVIERKKAKAGRSVVNFRSTASFTPKENYERYRWDKDGFKATVENAKATADFQGPILWEFMKDPYMGSYFTFPTPVNILSQGTAGVITEEEVNRQLDSLGAYNNTKDYSRLFLRTAVTQTYNVDLSGGSDKALYYFSSNYVGGRSAQIKNDNNRFQVTGRTLFNLSKKISFEVGTSYQELRKNAAPVPGIESLYAYERLQDENGNHSPVFSNSFVNPYYNQTLIDAGLSDNLYYPLQEVNEVSEKTHGMNTRITADLRYNILKDLNLHIGGVYERAKSEANNLATENSSIVRQFMNYYAEDDFMGGYKYNFPKGSFLRNSLTDNRSYTARAQLNYDKQFAGDHFINLIAGGEIRDIVDKSHASAIIGYDDQTLIHESVDYKYLDTYTGYAMAMFAPFNPYASYQDLFRLTENVNRFVSVYSNLIYTFKEKYSLSGSLRVDQSNLFGTDPKYQYKPLWSLGAGWNIDRENFLQGASWLNALKLRAAYGFNGNVAKNSLPQVIAQASNNFFNQNNPVRSLFLLSHANSGLRWEKTNNINIGVDYSIFKNITGNVEYYRKKSTDLLATSQIDPSKGGSFATINQASVQNTGLEFNLNANWISHRKFNWNSGLVMAHNENKVLQFYHVEPALRARTIGRPLGAIFNYHHAGLDADGEMLITDKNGVNQKFTPELYNEGILFAGNRIPSFNMGLSNRFDIGRFCLYGMVNYFGGMVTELPIPDAGAVRPIEGVNNFWKAPGDEANPDLLPKQRYLYTSWLARSDKYTVNAAYFTLGDITTAYSFKGMGWTRKAGLSDLEVKLQASNLYTVALNKQNFSLATGSFAKSYLTPTYSFFVNVSF